MFVFLKKSVLLPHFHIVCLLSVLYELHTPLQKDPSLVSQWVSVACTSVRASQQLCASWTRFSEAAVSILSVSAEYSDPKQEIKRAEFP